MEYVRLTKGVKDIGIFVNESDIPRLINDKDAFYKSLYYYPEEGKQYFEKHGRIKGYRGKVTTSLVTFDVDSEDLEISRRNLVRLIDYLKTIGMYREMAAIISFSGSKGYHLDIQTEYEFKPSELKKLCMHIAKQVEFIEEAGFNIDSTVYNTNRIFRIVNTINEKSGLYKVHVPEQDLRNNTSEIIKRYASTQQTKFEFEDQIPKFIIEDILKGIKGKDKPRVNLDFKTMPKKSKNIEDYPCYYSLLNGEMKAGESNSGLLRLAQFYKDAGYTIDQVKDKLVLAGHNRMKMYPETNEIDDEKIDYEILGCIFDKTGGYTFGKSDEFLKKRCSGTCLLHNPPIRQVKGLSMKKGFGNFKAKPVIEKPKVGFKKKEVKAPEHFRSFEDSAKSYKEYAKTINTRTIKTGIKELDKYAKILPTGITFINARPGVGKTTLILNMFDNNPDVTFLFYCADMVEDEFFEKVKSKVLKISPDEVRELYSDDHYAELRDKADVEIQSRFRNVIINYNKRLTTDDIKSDLEYFKSIGKKIDCICIDYVQKLEGGDDYNKNIQNISQLKVIQDKYKLPIVGLSQIPRQGGDEESPVLNVAAAKGGSIYEETGSIIMNAWRPLKHCPEKGTDNTITVCIVKNRMGDCPPPFPLHFNGAISEVRSKTPQELEEYEINMEAYNEAKQEHKKKTGRFR